MAKRDVASIICQALGRGVTRSKRRAMQWRRKSAENGDADSCWQLAGRMYMDQPYAREVGHVVEAAAVATSVGVMEGHDVPDEVVTGVAHWLRMGGHDIVASLDVLRRDALDGGAYCRNDGCEVVGQLKDFKVCPQCKTTRYCGDACQKLDWNAGGHKVTCGTFAAEGTQSRQP
jgi:TPR repeat protein